jgi:pantothenate kinase
VQLVMSESVAKDSKEQAYKPSDLAASLLHMIGGNIAQLAYLTGALLGHVCPLLPTMLAPWYRCVAPLHPQSPHLLLRFSGFAAKHEKTSRVIFCGNFLRRNLISAGFLSYSINYWSVSVTVDLFPS